MTDRIALAARNNALWCDAVCRSHGIRGHLDDTIWASPTRTPPYYPDAVTLSPDLDEYEVLARVDSSDGCSVKDSYAVLDLSVEDFARLVDGTWLWHDGAGVGARDGGRTWTTVSTASGLEEWQSVWSRGEADAAIFRATLLAEPGVHVLAAHDAGSPDGPIVAGAAINVTGGVAGVSNLFDAEGDEARAWGEVVAAAGPITGGLPLVGWEAGDSLTAAVAAGCEAIGPLTVWIR